MSPQRKCHFTCTYVPKVRRVSPATFIHVTWSYIHVTWKPRRWWNRLSDGFDKRNRLKLTWEQGDQLSVWKIRPKCSPNPFYQSQCIIFIVEKHSPKVRATVGSFQKLTKVNNIPKDENSTILVTLPGTDLDWWEEERERMESRER
jgi:hypothetical protein